MLGEARLRPVGQSGTLRVPTSPDDFGADRARGLAAFGASLASGAQGVVSEFEKRRDDREAIDVQERMNMAEVDTQQYLLGISQRREVEARGATDETSKWLDEYGTKAKKGLSQRAQRSFGLKFAQLTGRTIDRAQSHEFTQGEAEKEGLVRRTYETQLNRVASAPGDLYEFESATLDYMGALMRGVGVAEERGRLLGDFVSNGHLMVLDRMGVDDPEAALEYFKVHEAEIAGVERAGAKRDLGGIRTVVAKRARQSAGVRIAEQVLGVEGTFADKADWIRANTGDDVDLRDAALKELEARIDEGSKSDRLADQQALEYARGRVEAAVNGGRLSGEYPAFEEIIAPSVESRLAETGDLDVLREYYEKQRRGEEPVGSVVDYYGLRNMAIGKDAANPDTPADPQLIAEFKNLDLVQMKIEGILNDAQLKDLSEIQLKIREGRLSEQEARSIRTPANVLGMLIQGVNTIEQRNIIAQRFHDAIGRYKDTHQGQEPDEVELSRIANGMAFNPPEKNIPQYSLGGGRADVNSGLMQMPVVGGIPLPADVFGGMGRAIQKFGGAGRADEIQRLAEAMALGGRDPHVQYDDKQYEDLWRVIKAER